MALPACRVQPFGDAPLEQWAGRSHTTGISGAGNTEIRGGLSGKPTLTLDFRKGICLTFIDLAMMAQTIAFQGVFATVVRAVE